MLRLAVTGGIACGKSAVASILAARQIPVCEADALARGLMQAGETVYGEVASAFGRDILNARGEIDRGLLGDLVFADVEARQKLNGIVHPAVVRGWQTWLKSLDAAEKIGVVVIPLLYEIGQSKNWDAVVCVATAESTQLRRLRERGLSRARAEARIRAQLPVSRKAAMADYVLLNEGSMDVLEEQTMRVVGRVLEN